MSEETNALLPSAIEAKKAAESAELATKPKKRHACTSCFRDFRYGEFVMHPPGEREILCAACAKRERPNQAMETIVYGARGKVPSMIDRERAAKSLKKMERHKRGVARERRIAANGGKLKRR
jgi:hypothetical protein